jgi:hypothetical protein
VRAEDEIQGYDSVPASNDTSQIQRFSTDELHTLLAPIALYPDALLAQIFPAATFKDQIADAYRYAQTAATPGTPPADTVWDPSVIALLNYPTVLKQLASDPTWTDQLGFAATYQMADVTSMIQQIRSEAQGAGNLASNAQQIVTSDDGAIEIAPANPDVIYVPQYDPYWVCHRHEDFFWGNPYPYGIWLSNVWDWHHHYINMYGGWRNGSWYRSPRPVFWQAHTRPIPSWYLRNSARNPGPPVRGRVRPLAHTQTVRPAVTEHPRAVRPAYQPRVTPEKHIVAPRPTYHNEAAGSEAGRQQALKESHRGQISRPAARPAPERHVAAVPRPAPRSAPAHEIINHPTNRAAATHESARGAASRSSGRRK